jgi:hypothetical protein
MADFRTAVVFTRVLVMRVPDDPARPASVAARCQVLRNLLGFSQVDEEMLREPGPPPRSVHILVKRG